MQQLILALTINGLVLAGAGLGPMALLAPRLGALAVLALAPAAGYALYSTALTWWLLQEGTAGEAAWPLAGLLLAVSAACLAATQVPALIGVPLSKEYKPSWAMKLSGSISLRSVRTGHTEGKGCRSTLVVSSDNQRVQADSRKAR